MPIILGAEGIFFRMWSEGRWHSGDNNYMKRLGQSADKLAYVTPAIISDDKLPNWYPKIIKTGQVSILRCAKGKKAYLLAGPSYPSSKGQIKLQMDKDIVAKILFDDKQQAMKQQNSFQKYYTEY